MKQILALLGFFLFLIYRYFTKFFVGDVSKVVDSETPISVYSVVIEKKAGESLGMRIGGFDDGNGVEIENVNENGIAEKAGVKKGSKIIKINDINCENFDYGKVLEILKNIDNKFTLVLQ